MAEYVFKKNNAGIRRLLQSDEMLAEMERQATKVGGNGETKPFIGFDRAKVFVSRGREKK